MAGEKRKEAKKRGEARSLMQKLPFCTVMEILSRLSSCFCMTQSRSEKKEARKGGEAETLMQQLPSSIVMEILSRVSLISLLHCRCVCKSWRDFVSDPIFARTQFTRASASMNRTTNVMAKIESPHGFLGIYLFELQSHHDYTQTHATPPTRSLIQQTKLRLPGKEPAYQKEVVSCCNGLLCLHKRSWLDTTSRVYVCNPFLGEYVALPQLKSNRNCIKFESYMLGFSPITGQYKALKFFNRHEDAEWDDVDPLWYPYCFPKTIAQVEVFTLGTDRWWRKVGKAACPFYVHNYHNRHNGVTLNGTLHWLSPCETSDIINCFHIDTEQLYTFPQPPNLRRHDVRRMSLGVLENCLCLFDHDGADMDVWSLKEYGVAQSWTIFCKFTISQPNPVPIPNYSLFYPFTLEGGGELLISTSTGCLLSYNPKEISLSMLKIHDTKLRGFVIPIDFVPSLVSLKDIAMPGSVRIVNA